MKPQRPVSDVELRVLAQMPEKELEEIYFFSHTRARRLAKEELKKRGRKFLFGIFLMSKK